MGVHIATPCLGFCSGFGSWSFFLGLGLRSRFGLGLGLASFGVVFLPGVTTSSPSLHTFKAKHSFV